MPYKKLLLSLIAMPLAGCASIMSGTSQDITIASNPEGAVCTLTRENKVIATVTATETIHISKLKHDIYVKCSMDGFHDSTAHVNSGTEGSTFGNILLGGGIGWAIDSARGADNKYPEVVTITMVPLTQNAPKTIIINNENESSSEKENISEEIEKDTSQDMKSSD